MADRDNFDYASLVNYVEGDFEYVGCENFDIVREINEFLGEPVDETLVKVELPLPEVVTLDVDKCLVCDKSWASGRKNTVWYKCVDRECDKLVCKACYVRFKTIRRQTPCVSCGRTYKAAGHSFKQCRKCKFWRYDRCVSDFECRCVPRLRLAGHRLRGRK